VVGLWAAAWAGFGAAWAVFLTMVTGLGQGSRGIAFGLALALVTAAPVVATLLPVRRDPVLRLLTRRAAMVALAPAGLAALIWLGSVGRPPLSIEPGMFLFGIAEFYLGPLALALAAGALRLGSLRTTTATVVGAGVCYILAGLFLLIPFIPLGGGYNPVGALFPVWGIGAPVAVAVRGLRRWSAPDGPSAADSGEENRPPTATPNTPSEEGGGPEA
jgi:hypothetical protein